MPLWEKGDETGARQMLLAETTQMQYTAGARDPETLNPDAWVLDQALLDRPGSAERQMALFKDYQHNVPLFDVWQAYFREHQPKTLVAWGRGDPFFGVPRRRGLPPRPEGRARRTARQRPLRAGRGCGARRRPDQADVLSRPGLPDAARHLQLETEMSHAFANIAFTPAVREAQARDGSRAQYARAFEAATPFAMPNSGRTRLHSSRPSAASTWPPCRRPAGPTCSTAVAALAS